MKKALKILSALMGVLVLVGLIIFFAIPRQKLLDKVAPKITHTSITNTKITEGIATMEVKLEVTSKLIPVFIDSISYDLQVFKQSIAKGKQAFTAGSKTNNLQKLVIPMAVRLNKARELIRRQLAEKEKIQAHVIAYYHFPIGCTRSIQIKPPLIITMPVLFGTKMEDFKLNNLKFNDKDSVITMNIDNP